MVHFSAMPFESNTPFTFSQSEKVNSQMGPKNTIPPPQVQHCPWKMLLGFGNFSSCELSKLRQGMVNLRPHKTLFFVCWRSGPYHGNHFWKKTNIDNHEYIYFQSAWFSYTTFFLWNQLSAWSWIAFQVDRYLVSYRADSSVPRWRFQRSSWKTKNCEPVGMGFKCCI